MCYDVILGALQALLETELNRPCAIGALPPVEGLALNPVSGSVKRDMTGNALVELRLNLNSKYADQRDAICAIGEAHEACMFKRYAGDGFQITGVSAREAPALVGQDGSGAYIYASTLQLRAFIYGTD